MQHSSEEERLRRLSRRLEELKRSTDPDAPRTEEHHTQAQMAWRMVTELVAGLLVGFGIGWGLDTLFGTRPWLLVLFTLLGFAAGVQTMMRTARELQLRSEQKPVEVPDETIPPAPRAGTEKEPAASAGRGQEEDAGRG